MKKPKLKRAIYRGVAIIVLLLLANGIVNYLGLSRLQQDHRNSRKNDTINAKALSIDRDVQELRLRVDRYVSLGHRSLKDEVDEIYQRLIQRFDYQGEMGRDGELRRLFEKIQYHLGKYVERFATVVREREIRDSLVDRKLPEKADEISLMISLQREQAGDESERGRRKVFELLRLENFVSLGERSFLRYFESYDSRFTDVGVQQLDSAIEAANELTSTDADEAAKLANAISRLKQIGLRTVQSTRNYLYSRNVVMAGEAAEVSWYSKQLRQVAQQRRDTLAERLESTSTMTSWITNSATVLMIGLAIFLASRLAMRIVPPISNLTGLLRRLAAGATEVEIPAANRDDEIGEMIESARAFSERNRQTRHLLKESESLRNELQKHADLLRSTNEELDSFAYVASHDLKSPLRGIRQLATWIEEDSGEVLPEESREFLDHMKSRVGKMEGLLEDLLEYSRVGRLEPPPASEINLGVMIGDIVDLLDNPDQIPIEYQNDLPVVLTNRSPLEQVLMNLIGNAIKHNDKGAEGRVKVDFAHRDGVAHFAVSDNGKGIRPEDQERVFQMYQRLNNSVQGSGMGLSIVKKQIENAGGKIELDSEYGTGASFRFTWPLNLVAERVEAEMS